MTAVLQAQSLTKRYGALTAVQELSLEVHEGEVFGLLGPNGAGKTTSISIMCGLLKPDSGQVIIRGKHFYRGGSSPGIYQDGAVANIKTFYESVTGGKFDNPTVETSVRSNLITILGRTAAYGNRMVTWDEMLKANEKLDANLKGVKA